MSHLAQSIEPKIMKSQQVNSIRTLSMISMETLSLILARHLEKISSVAQDQVDHKYFQGLVPHRSDSIHDIFGELEVIGDQ